MNSLAEIVHFLHNRDSFIIVGHEGPDPDSLGSMLGLYFGLSKLGKRCRLVSADPLPPYLTWPGLENIEFCGEEFTPGDSCVLVVDCEPQRTGTIAQGVLQAKELVNIDHHQRGRGVGDLVYVDPSEAATSVIIYRLLKELRVPFDVNLATVLYGGIVGDTGGFRHANTNSEVLRIAGELLDYGVEPARIAREIFSMQPLGFMQLLGYALSHLHTALEGRLVWMAVSSEEFGRFDVDPEMTDHLVSYARMLDSAEIAMVFREVRPGLTRLGLRSNAVDVAKLARHFGGGGHKLASGATLHGSFSEIVSQVTGTAERYLATGEIDERDN
ncbi:MAG: bifunctional oligoribonuclease/PAP phosphatase NrnA [Firmicutes bacterium]|nr:bifunctional oligoribonuclease/PAP phosphatase NrnA [Bacillota bacterium]